MIPRWAGGSRKPFANAAKESILDANDRQLLAVLDERGGSTTKLVTEQAGLYLDASPQAKWRWTRRRLLSLKKAGLVGVLDDQKPVCWLRTSAGTDALAAS